MARSAVTGAVGFTVVVSLATWRWKSSTHPARGSVSQRQGCRGWLRTWRKPEAKCWPDEQEADEAAQRGEVAIIAKARYLVCAP